MKTVCFKEHKHGHRKCTNITVYTHIIVLTQKNHKKQCFNFLKMLKMVSSFKMFFFFIFH